MKKKIIIGVFLLLSTLFISTPQARAVDNDDDSIPICDITMSGVDLNPSINPTVKPTRQTPDSGGLIPDGGNFFPFEACITNPAMRSQLDACIETGGSVKLSALLGGWTWGYYPLERNGYCFSTELNFPNGTSAELNRMDIETIGGNCPEETPLCRRVSADVDRSSTIGNEERCQAARDNFNCNEVSSSPTDIVINEPLSFSFPIDPLLDDWETCGTEFDDFSYVIKSSTGSVEQNGRLDIGNNDFSFTPEILTTHTLILQGYESINGQIYDSVRCEVNFSVGTETNPGEMGEVDGGENGGGIERLELCEQIPAETTAGEITRGKCETCFNQNGIWTAIGCIDTTSTESIVGKLMTVGMSIAGGIALLMILASAFLFATSEGEPKRTGEAKEILTSAIIGLIFIIFSVTILQFIGVNILRIPGFGE